MGSGGVGRVRYRAFQGLRALLSPLTPLDIAARDAALALLPAQAASAFRALPRVDQRHALAVYHGLVTQSETDPDLLAAALLHDIGKHPGVGVTQRTVRVLLSRQPHFLSRMVSTVWLPRRWRTGLGQLLDHPSIGADRAAAWGCSPATVAIIRMSHDANAPAIVRRLQAADDER